MRPHELVRAGQHQVRLSEEVSIDVGDPAGHLNSFILELDVCGNGVVLITRRY
jgi:hypothetical protein